MRTTNCGAATAALYVGLTITTLMPKATPNLVVGYPQVGVYLTETENLVLTAGEAVLDASYEITYPEVSEDHETCKPLSSDTKDKIVLATKKYKQNIATYINLQESPTSNGNGTETKSSDPFDTCAETDNCVIAPLLSEGLMGNELWPIPCMTPGSGNMASCNNHKTNSSYTSCCDIRTTESTKFCPTGQMVKAKSVIRKWKGLHSRHKFNIGGSLHGVKKWNSYCFAITHLEADGKLQRVNEQKIDVSPSHSTWYLKTHRRRKRSTDGTKRVRRSWSNILHYYMAGGPLTPKFTMEQIKKLKKEENLKVNDLKDALAADEAAIVRLQREDGKASLSKKICDLGDKLTEELIVENLKAQQDAEFLKVQTLVGTCEEGTVPNEVSTSLLEQMCKASSDSPTCWSLKTRSLTSCSVRFVQMLEDRVIVVLRLTQRIPTSESLSLFAVQTVPVYTDKFAVNNKPKMTTVAPTTLDQRRIIAEKLAKLLAKRKKRAAVQSHFVTRELRLPEYLVISGDVTNINSETRILTFNSMHKQGRLLLLFAEERLPQDACLEALVKQTELNPNEKFPTEKCLVKEERTTSQCSVRSLPAGYVVSTPKENEIDIISAKSKQTNSVFGAASNDMARCRVCIVKPIAETSQRFRCDGTDYLVREESKIIIEHVNKQVNVDLREFREKDDVLPALFGIEKLDNIQTDKHYQNAMKIFTIIAIVGLYIGLALFIICKFGKRCARPGAPLRCCDKPYQGFKKAM